MFFSSSQTWIKNNVEHVENKNMWGAVSLQVKCMWEGSPPTAAQAMRGLRAERSVFGQVIAVTLVPLMLPWCNWRKRYFVAVTLLPLA
jgi:hypothetical protein